MPIPSQTAQMLPVSGTSSRQASFRAAIAGGGIPSKQGSNPIHLISQGPIDHGIVPETGIDVPSNACCRTAKPRDWMLRSRKGWILPARIEHFIGIPGPILPPPVDVGYALSRGATVFTSNHDENRERSGYHTTGNAIRIESLYASLPA